MRRAGLVTLGMTALMVALVSACGNDKPETFMDVCDPDAGETNCKAPFECIQPEPLESDPAPIPFCTEPCKRDTDCPHWYNESGHCQGPFHAICDRGYCQGWCL